MTGNDLLPRDTAKQEIEKYCTNELGKKGQEKDNLLKQIWAELEEEEAIKPFRFVDFLKMARDN